MDTCCNKCLVKEIETGNNEYTPISNPFCLNPSCECHKELPDRGIEFYQTNPPLTLERIGRKSSEHFGEKRWWVQCVLLMRL